ncbi:MAG: hypothetical protein ABSE87_14185 [Terracidiphilus sp.]|jgi:hypothetical protein
MRLFPIPTLASITLGIALAGSASAAAQSPQTGTQHTRIFGYQDPQTGAFHPLAHTVPLVTTAPTTGKYEVTFDITIDSTFPKGATLLCNVDLIESSVTESTTPTVIEYGETASSSMAVSGSTATCTVNLPYSWAIPASTAKAPVVSTVSGSYSVFVFSSSSTTITSATLEGLRSVSSTLPIPTTVPKSGATTTATVDATL